MNGSRITVTAPIVLLLATVCLACLTRYLLKLDTANRARTFPKSDESGTFQVYGLLPVETAQGQKTQSHVTFLMNFSDELRRKVPVGK
jgi:hypothetical protein